MQHSDIVNTILKNEKITKKALAEALGISNQFLWEVSKGSKNFSQEKLSSIKKLYPEYFPDEPIKLPAVFNKDSFRDIRLKLGYSQIDFAKKLDISQTLIAKYESGDRNISKFTREKLKALISNSNIKSEHDSSLVNMPYYENIVISSSFNITLLKSPSRHVKFDRFLIESCSKLEINPDKCIVIGLDSSSLIPGYSINDKVVLDTSFNKFVDNHYFVFGFNGSCYTGKIRIHNKQIECILPDRQNTFYLDCDSDYVVYGLVVPRIRL